MVCIDNQIYTYVYIIYNDNITYSEKWRKSDQTKEINILLGVDIAQNFYNRLTSNRGMVKSPKKW